MLRQGHIISKEVTDRIINLCEENTPDRSLIANICKIKELQYEEDGVEFTGLEEPFARHYFEYERFRSVFENRLDSAAACNYQDMQKEFEDAGYTLEMKNLLEMKSDQIAKIVNG